MNDELYDIIIDCNANNYHGTGKCYRKLPRKPRMLASGMNWQNKFKKHLTNSKYDSILYM